MGSESVGGSGKVALLTPSLLLNLVTAGLTTSAHAQGTANNGAAAPGGLCFRRPAPTWPPTARRQAFRSAPGRPRVSRNISSARTAISAKCFPRARSARDHTLAVQAGAGAAISYKFGSERRSIADYLGQNPTTGLLIAKDDTILYEHYQYARTDRDRFLSQSMAKTITAMLIGIAVSEGKIKSIDDPVSAYVPGLANPEYGKTSIRDLLHMSSGVAFSEIYDGQDDIARLSRDLFSESGKDPIASVAQFNTRAAPPRTKWHYASVETEILGLVLRSATGEPLADYLHEQDLGRDRRRGRRGLGHRCHRPGDRLLLL